MELTTIALVLLGLGLGYLLVRIVQNRGIKGALFGAPVVRELGELELEHRQIGIVKTRLRVHELGGGEGPAVGLELVYTAPLSYKMETVTMTIAEAAALAEILLQAAKRISIQRRENRT